MANKIVLKKSSVAAKVPLATDLDIGELAVNLADAKLYTKNAGGTVIQLGGGSGSGTVTSVALSGGTTGLTITGSPITTSGTITLGGTLAVANGGTGVTSSSGANSVVLRDANNNITANAYFNGFTSVAASGTQITLTVASTPVYLVTGSGGQTIQLPNATTLPNGTIFSFNNNQSSGAITVNNNSGTSIASVPSGAYVTVVLTSNASAAGSWDRHDQAPSNVSWSTNTLDYAGSITSATWNGNVVAYNRGGTGQSSAFVAGGVAYGASTSALAVTPIGTSGQVLTSQGAGAPIWTTPATGTVTSVSMTVPTGLSISGSPITTSGTLALSLTAGYSIPTTASQTNWDSAYTQRLQWDGGSTNLTASTGRTSLGATTIGSNLFTLTNPSSVTFPRFNADNTISALDAATFRTAIGAGTSSTTGTVTSVSGTGTVAGISLSGTVTSSGNISLGGTFALPTGQVPGKMIYDSFTATAGQTTFTTSTTYTSGKIEVVVNGCSMVNGSDVTVTSGTSIVFATGLTVNDRVTAIYPT
jgi:hypothetical protein